jgi:hypothetical protein
MESTKKEFAKQGNNFQALAEDYSKSQSFSLWGDKLPRRERNWQ